MVVITIIGTLAAIAIPNYISFREKAFIIKEISNLKIIEKTIIIFQINNGRLPVTLAEAGLGTPVDLWGNPYVYKPCGQHASGSPSQGSCLGAGEH